MAKLDEIIEQLASGINRTPEEFLEAVRKSGMSYNESGELCNPVDGKLIPAESQKGALHIVYHNIREEIKSVGRAETVKIDSGEADVLPSDGEKTQAIKKVILPTLLDILAGELHCSSEIAQEAITKNGILYDIKEDRFYNLQVGEDIIVEFEEVVKYGRDYLASLVAPAETLPKAEGTVLPDTEVRVAVPIQLSKADYLKPLVQEFKREPEELEDVLEKAGYHVREKSGFFRGDLDESGSGTTTPILETEVRDFLLEYYTNPRSEENVPMSEVAASGPAATADLEETTDIDADVEAEVIPNPKEKYFTLLTSAFGKSNDEIETALGKKMYGLNLNNGHFYRLPPEPDGELGGEEVTLLEVNNALGEYFAPERTLRADDIIPAAEKAIVSQPEAVATDSSRATIPETKAVLPPLEKGDNGLSSSPVEKEFYNQKTPPNLDTNGDDKLLAESAAAVNQSENIAKRPLWTYITGGIGAIAVLGLTHLIAYDSGKTVGEAGKTVIQDKVGAALVEDLNAQIGDLDSELNAVSADNENYTSDKAIMKLNYNSCEKEWGETKTQLGQRNTAYANLEQQLAAAPKVQEFVALKDRNAKLETEKEQSSIKVQDAKQKYDTCIAAKTACESAAPMIEYVDRIVEREVPVEKIVEKEVVKYLAQECPTVECPAGNTELQANYAACMKEKDAVVQTIEDADTSYAICEVNREAIQSIYDGCMGELNTSRTTTSDSRYVAIKEILESSKSTKGKGEALSNLVENYVKELGGAVSIAANGVCETALSNLYHAITPVKDDDVGHNFTLTFTEAGICDDFKPGSKYLTLEVVNE